MAEILNARARITLAGAGLISSTLNVAAISALVTFLTLVIVAYPSILVDV
ncbi:MAG TPA: hypothetical protein VHJ19_09480 [Gammaproteobacteria bacterium]|nr:hypothetical protein [Gammaproteobacteria bacterium]